MTDTNRVKKAIEAGKRTIQGVMEFLGDDAPPRPSVRRILGQGAIKGIFKREARGVYTLKTDDGQEIAVVQCGKAEEELPKLAAQGRKFDSVFLDIPYFSKGLIGGNRKPIKYDFLYPKQFYKMMEALKGMMRTEESHVYLMLSAAPSCQKEMKIYLDCMYHWGFKMVKDGRYNKTYGDGSPIKNISGNEAAPERLMLFTLSGQARAGESPEIVMDFTAPRPNLKTSYATQKDEDMLKQLIQQSTLPGDHVADPCAGSGIFGKAALLLNRFVTMIEASIEAIENHIVPKLKEFAI